MIEAIGTLAIIAGVWLTFATILGSTSWAQRQHDILHPPTRPSRYSYLSAYRDRAPRPQPNGRTANGLYLPGSQEHIDFLEWQRTGNLPTR